MNEIKYSQIVEENNKLEAALGGDKYNIKILSNIMVHQSKDIFEYVLRKESINAHVSIGEYDNIVQESYSSSSSDAIIVFWEIYNFVDGLQYKIEHLSDDEYSDIVDRVKSEIDIVTQNLKNVPVICINKFSSLIFSHQNLNIDRLSALATTLNDYLIEKENVQSNIKLINVDNVISRKSIYQATDLRYYYSSKTLYSIDFYKDYFNHVAPFFLAVNGKIKKALIFDCDNTLWKGIVGEDGVLSLKIFEEVQSLALGLAKKGVVIGLCSKNNLADVDEVLQKHPKMILKDSDVVIKKVNWDDKATNLKIIADELNIGLESIVFVDDSDFEINLVREQLPQVKTFCVPKREYEYSAMFREITNLFYNPSVTVEDINKIKIYKAQIQRSDSVKASTNLDDYLEKLELEVNVNIDDRSLAPRLSQLCQKTNQFNLTTKRYTESDIARYIDANDKKVIAIGVKDKFGDSGVVGLCILGFLEKKASIDTLLMSCRVLGRNIEYKFIDIIIEFLKNEKIEIVEGEYAETLKNVQVRDLYDKCGFVLDEKKAKKVCYVLELSKYQSKNLNYIEVRYGK